MALLIGLDNGMGNNKLYFRFKGKEYYADFPSRVAKLEAETTDTIYIDNEPYSFEQGRIAAELGHLTKEEEIHRLLLKKAAYMVYELTGETSFDVSTNCSLDSYKDDSGNRVRDFMTESKEFTIKELFKDEVKLQINKLVCLPECLSGSLLAPLQMKKEDVIAVDIGTKNWQLIQIIQGIPVYERSFATNYGMNHIYAGISDVVKVHERGLRTPGAIKMYLEKTSEDPSLRIEAVEATILKYLMANIFPEIDMRLGDMDLSMYTKLVFLGGGATLLKRFLEVKFSGEVADIIFIENAYFANAIGLYKKGERLLNHNEKLIKKKLQIKK